MPSPRNLILASSSPRRRQLLTEAGFLFTVDPADVDESDFDPALSPVAVAELLAERKGRRVAERHPEGVTLSADTVVALDDRTIGKAADIHEARLILSSLSGSRHEVITAVRLLAPKTGLDLARTVRSAVVMRQLTAQELEDYLLTGLWEGKAGAYGIQDNDPFVTRIEGSLSNIVGLPMEATLEMLAMAGVSRES